VSCDSPSSRCAIQDELPPYACWGCGPENALGLRIKSYWTGDATVCRYRPESHQAGWPGVLNGGILASLVDCHCVCTAMSGARRALTEIRNDETPVAFATGSLSISYLRPVPIDATVELTARIVERSSRKTRLECTVVARGELCARAEVVAVRVMGALAPQNGQMVA
jgi:acyl-coenzyme A thioesterase PaaI-like protein